MSESKKEFFKPSVTADIVAVDIHQAKFRSDGAFVNIVLVKRDDKSDAFPGEWALPGGFLESGESIPSCAVREFKEETGIFSKMLAPIGVFSNPARDPRGQVVSNAFLTVLMSSDEQPLPLKAGDDAKEVRLFRIKGSFSQEDGSLSVTLRCAESKDEISFTAAFSRDEFGLVSTKIEYKGDKRLAFDHAEIIARAILKTPDIVLPTRDKTVEEEKEAKKQLSDHLAK